MRKFLYFSLVNNLVNVLVNNFETIFVNPEGSHFCQSVRVLFLSIRKRPIFVNPEGS